MLKITISRLLDLLFPSFPAIFKSQHSLIESLEKLRRISDPASDFATLIGHVDGKKVSLQMPTFVIQRGYIAMRFAGKFLQADSSVILIGRFTMATGLKICFGCVYGFFIFGIAETIVHTPSQPHLGWRFSFGIWTLPVIFFIFHNLFQRYYNDQSLISREIKRALS